MKFAGFWRPWRHESYIFSAPRSKKIFMASEFWPLHLCPFSSKCLARLCSSPCNVFNIFQENACQVDEPKWISLKHTVSCNLLSVCSFKVTSERVWLKSFFPQLYNILQNYKGIFYLTFQVCVRKSENLPVLLKVQHVQWHQIS